MIHYEYVSLIDSLYAILQDFDFTYTIVHLQQVHDIGVGGGICV